MNLDLVTPKTTSVPREKILSGPFNAPTQGSYQHAAPTLVPVQDAQGNIIYKNITSSNVFTIKDLGRNGYASAQIDDGVSRGNYDFAPFDSWKAGSKPPILNEHVIIRKTPDSALTVGFGERLWQAPVGQTPLKKYVTPVTLRDYPINDAGRGIYLAGNAKHGIMEYLRTREGQEFASLLRSSGGKPEEITDICVGGLPDNAIYGVSRRNGNIVLHAAEDAWDKIVKDAKHYGINPKDRKNAGLAEEIAHIWLRHLDGEGDSIKKEIEAKLTVAENFARLERDYASGNPNNPNYTREKGRYGRLKEMKEEDARTTPARYRDLYSKDKASLKLMLEMDAMEKGLRGGAVEEYVEGRLAQIEGEAEGKPLSRLERIADRGVKEASGKTEPSSGEAPQEAEAEAEATAEPTASGD